MTVARDEVRAIKAEAVSTSRTNHGVETSSGAEVNPRVLIPPANQSSLLQIRGVIDGIAARP